MTPQELNQFSIDFRKENTVNPFAVFRATGNRWAYVIDFQNEADFKEN